ncbi:MAG: hypothetical protein AAGM84_00645 [Pseudomonadota bacterium]
MNELEEERGYSRDLRDEIAVLKRTIAGLPADSEDAVALKEELLGVEDALAKSEARIKELSQKDRRTVRITGKKDDKATGKDRPSGNEIRAVVKDPCKAAESVRLPPTRYPYEVGVNSIIPVQAREPLARLKKTEAELKNLMILCLDPWDATFSRAWADRFAFLIDELLRAEEDFAFGMSGGFTEEELATITAVYDSSSDLSGIKTREEALRVAYLELWDKVNDFIERYRLGPDSSLRLGLLSWQEQAQKARLAYEKVAQQRSALEIDRIRSLKQIRKERIASGIEYLNERVPETAQFSLLKQTDLLGKGPNVVPTLKRLLGAEGYKVHLRQTDRRHRSGGYRIIERD